MATRSRAVKERVHQALIERLGPRLYDPHLSEAELAAQVRQTLQTVIELRADPAVGRRPDPDRPGGRDEILGHGPLEPLLRDPDVTEIMVNGPDDIYVERAGKLYPVDAQFSDDAHLRRTIDKIVVAGRPADRRGQPAGRRPAARRLPRQRGHPADRARRRDR